MYLLRLSHITGGADKSLARSRFRTEALLLSIAFEDIIRAAHNGGIDLFPDQAEEVDDAMLVILLVSLDEYISNTSAVHGVEARMRWYLRLQSKRIAPSENVPSKYPGDSIPPQDRCSIKVLLNSGSASFIEFFRFPDRADQKTLYETNLASSSSTRENDTGAQGPAFEMPHNENADFSDPFGSLPTDWLDFENEDLLEVLNIPFSGMLGMADGFTTDFSIPHNPEIIPPISLPPQTDHETPSVQSTTIIQALGAKASQLGLNAPAQEHILQILNYLFTPSRIEGFVKIFFDSFYPHCPLIHAPSYSVDTSPIPLLLILAVMGAMYSTNETDLSSAKLILDLVELYIFSLDDFTEEFDIRNFLRLSTGENSRKEQESDPLAFQNLQAAYLIALVQFWAGNKAARKRSMEIRYNTVIRAARKLGLTGVRHGMHDSISESLWIENESKISTSELKFDLPCPESVFAAAHPFLESSFDLSRNTTTYEAFQSLFEPITPQSGTKQEISEPINPLRFTPLDMFVLIHREYPMACNG
ncbi:hypothetical protein F5884DRAFT_755982 [Xylogone sp. PMI_703]|nr:hypothetical protein F5884DRAFT_755982 [Xylogone sp. PMI_703]